MDGHGGAAPAWLLALEQSGIGEAMRQSLWLYPAANILHVLAAGVVIGAILAFDLRLLGLGSRVPVAPLAGLLPPLAACGIAVALPTGFLMFTADARAVAENPVFPYKLGLIALGLVNVAILHAGALRGIAGWGAGVPAAARVAAAVSLLAWTGTATAGRLIAYF
ncbi:hypothetical protein [Arenibaculum pallidiluteum]|uniref:hypothetical protein n=1 Tax=Arenibaculum pallidiluteum TaxID=2812559 RepID=UPI001A969D0B|nr:hypothetical protein [Arenibaculum pallidiluteum]